MIKPITIITVISLSFIFSIVNTAFKVENKNLKTDISQFTDENAHLRAKYLSKISAANLSYRADDFEMSQQTVLEIKNKKQNSESEKEVFINHKKLIVSGY